MSDLKNNWLVAGHVVTTDKKGTERRKSLNILLVTKVNAISRKDLDNAQKSLMHRFVGETEQIKGFEISDVFILSINHLGAMTHEEFQAGFLAEKSNEPKSPQELN